MGKAVNVNVDMNAAMTNVMADATRKQEKGRGAAEEIKQVKAEQERKEQVAKEMYDRKNVRTEQRSVKVDPVTAIRLGLIKSVQKKNGVPKPSTYDFIYEAIVEKMNREYPQTLDIAMQMQELGL